MRKIKFRAWDKINRKWFVGNDNISIQIHKSYISDDELNGIVLMQFTGLKDKNGKEIYQFDCLNGIYEGLFVDWCDKQGGWEMFNQDHGCFACLGDLTWREVVEDINKSEVIGNIFENPELLK